MCDGIEVESYRDTGHVLIDWIQEYCDTESDTGRCNARNRILISVVDGNAAKFVQLLLTAFQDVASIRQPKDDDVARKKNFVKLFYEIASRSEHLDYGDAVMPFLAECLDHKVCIHYAIVSMRALLQRHVTLSKVDHELLVRLQSFYDTALSYNIASLAQQPRIDFLWITQFLLDSYKRVGQVCPKHVIKQFCRVVVGEKDPRNLLLLFDILVTFAGFDSDDEDIDILSQVYTAYYPIQFIPPKNDVIGITPMELKAALLRVFKASHKFGKHSLEVIIDCLYSGYASKEEHATVIADALRYFNECLPVYGQKCYTAHLDSLLDVFTSEFLQVSREESTDHIPIPLDLVTTTDQDTPTISECINVSCANRIAKAYYNGWASVSKQLKLFGEVLKFYLQSVDIHSCKDRIVRFLVELRDQLVAEASKYPDANVHAAYFLDILSGIEPLHRLLLDHVALPLCSAVIVSYADYDKGQMSESDLHAELSRIVPILGNTLFPKIVGLIKHPLKHEHANGITLAGLCCIRLNDMELFSAGLRLVTLAVTASKTAMVEQVLTHCLKESGVISGTTPVCGNQRIKLYAEAFIAMFKAHFYDSGFVLNAVQRVSDSILSTLDIEDTVKAYVMTDVDISRELAEIMAITIDKCEDVSVVNGIVDALTKCFVYVCENPGSTITTFVAILSLALTANPNKVAPRLGELLSYDTLLRYYKTLIVQGNPTAGLLKFGTTIIPQYMSIVLISQPSISVERLLADGLGMLIPVLIVNPNDDMVDVLVGYSRTKGVSTAEMEMIGLVLHRWITGHLEITNSAMYNDGLAVDLEEDNAQLMEEDKRRHNRLERVVTSGLHPCAMVYILEAMNYNTAVGLGLGSYIKSLPLTCLMAFVSRMCPFVPDKLAANMELCGFNLKSTGTGMLSYNDLFLTDGTQIEQLPYVEKMQYKFVKAHCNVGTTSDMRLVKWLIEILAPINRDLNSLVAIATILLHMDDGLLTSEYANIVNVILQQYVELGNNLDHIKITALQTPELGLQKTSKDDTNAYETWLQHEFFFLSQIILLRILCQHEDDDANKRTFVYYPVQSQDNVMKKDRNPALCLEVDQWERFVDGAVNVAIKTAVPICRILAILIVHCVVTQSPKTIPGTYCKAVMKRMSQCLGDRCQQARMVALTCRHKWLQK
ncbi:DNA repair/transcription protein MET18/MMS19 domain protein [Babesia bovis T2Bo]|uniref:DNA repair/transcription protein MET18/MMS19 domain protein n=1 Tax=Babesia bovis T2Bo TaxID=484906 RepID=UPI001D30D029|nr:DNA repair/transcription protein MET18/MMS19 domain protein [Babesia bovis T2Bo]KAG6439936.1 DNA repair/transcription protein MET18/MMS19 domain protein [Babesia bovis T2Bo]